MRTASEQYMRDKFILWQLYYDGKKFGEETQRRKEIQRTARAVRNCLRRVHNIAQPELKVGWGSHWTSFGWKPYLIQSYEAWLKFTRRFDAPGYTMNPVLRRKIEILSKYDQMFDDNHGDDAIWHEIECAPEYPEQECRGDHLREIREWLLTELA